MEKEFIKKMIKAEILRYEAIKEILPDRAKKHIDAIEKDAVEVIKDFALEIIKDNTSSKEQQTKKEIKKVNVDFS